MKQILVYSKERCPYCERAKDYFKSRNILFHEIDVSNNEARLDEMIEKSHGRKTVPQIFIGEYHVGGWDDLNALIQAGKLESYL